MSVLTATLLLLTIQPAPQSEVRYAMKYDPAVVEYSHRYDFRYDIGVKWIALPMPSTNEVHRIDDFRITMDGQEVPYEKELSSEGEPWAVLSGGGRKMGRLEYHVKMLHWQGRLVEARFVNKDAPKPAPPTMDEVNRYRKVNANAEPVKAEIQSFMEKHNLKSDSALELQFSLAKVFQQNFTFEDGASDVARVLKDGKFNCNGGSVLGAGITALAGFPAKNMYGILMSAGGGHQVYAVFQDGQWIPVDSTRLPHRGSDSTYPFVSERMLVVQSSTKTTFASKDKGFDLRAKTVHSAFFISADGKMLPRVQGVKSRFELRPASK